MDKINLDKVLLSTKYDFDRLTKEDIETIKDGLIPYSFDEIKTAMLSFGKQLLELAAENAKIYETEEDIERRVNCVDEDGNVLDEIYYFDPAFVDKQSIIDIIKQVE